MRVLIITDNAVAAEAMRRELRHAPGCEVLGYVNGRHECAGTVAAAAPDVVVVDDMGSRPNALDRIRDARCAVPGAKIVLLTGQMEGDWLADASHAGIDAAIAKTPRATTIGTLVREIVAGQVYHAFAPGTAAVRTSQVPSDLTARELEILKLAAGGSSNGKIARELFVTEQTVKFHLSNVYRKLGVVNRTEASHFAYTHGLLDSPARQDAAGAALPVRLAA